MAMPMEATYHFVHALLLARKWSRAGEEKRREILGILLEHERKLELWARNCPANFRAKHALVAAEIARIGGDELEAERRYEEAIRSARESGFVHWQAIAGELCADFHRGRGFETVADAYLRDALCCYARWGADAKVRQIEQRYPALRDGGAVSPAATFAARAEQLDLLSVTKASQTISGEIVLEKLVHTLLEVVLQQGGAERACLILCRDRTLSIEAEAALDAKGVVISVLGAAPLSSSQRVPISVVHYVQRMRERVILSNAAVDAGKFAADDYLARVRPRAVLCLPILRQAEVVGLLYLENNLLTGAFTADRLAALELLATQAAISLQNAQLLAGERAGRAAAEDAVRVRSEFLTVASHELNTPVTSLMLAVQSLRRAAPSGRPIDPARMEKLIDLAARQAGRLTKLIGDLLDVSRIETGRVSLDLTDVDLGALVRDVVLRFEPDLTRSRCRVSIAEEARVVGSWDRSSIDQIVSNLLSNAIKFGAGEAIEIAVSSEGAAARVAVTDHGIGIDPAQCARIFGRFERAVSDRHYGGLGLGLYISRRLAEQHDGSLLCESRPGAGSTFTLELPRARPPLAGA